MFSGFFISVSIGNILNMIYAVMLDATVILVLHFLTLFFMFFGIVFVFIVNMIILESTLVFSVKRQNRYILFYGILLFVGMLILVILGKIFGKVIHENTKMDPFLGVKISDGVPQWGPIFFIYLVLIITGFTIIPIIYTNFKIYFRFERKALKRKWACYLIGSLGVIAIMYSLMINNLLNNLVHDEEYRSIIRSIISIAGISIILWVSLMYYGIGTKLKK